MVLVVVGLGYTLATKDKAGLVVAFAGVTLLAYGALKPQKPGSGDGPHF